MSPLPPNPNLEHLKKQAKDLLRRYREGDAAALARFAEYLPAAAGKSPSAITAMGFRLADAQSCIARSYGFASWAEVALHVEADIFARGDRATAIRRWLDLAYGGDATGNLDAARPRLAARLLQETPDVFTADLAVACATGDVGPIARAIAADPQWLDRPLGPLALPPLVAVTHSRLGALPEFQARLRAAAQALLDAGADPNQRILNRFPPYSLAKPDENGPLSALYGAAGVNHDPELTAMLLEAGADPNDGESLYHSLESPDVTRILLAHGARVAGTNALRRSLDMLEPEALELLLAHGGDPNEPAPTGPTAIWGPPLLRAIAVRRSPRHIAALLEAGADPRARTPGGVSAYALAMQTGLTEVADLLRQAGAAEPLAPADAFIAACARADLDTARAIQARHPDLPASLPPDRLRLLPDEAAWGNRHAVETMVACAWPLDARGGDWDATALNHAVMRGDASLADFLLAHGADWREGHGYGDNVLGTLSWASINEPNAHESVDGPDPDWSACARALKAHGLPRIEPDPTNPLRVLIDGRPMRFSETVTEILLAEN
jgi:ankyrin repeat protein